MYYILGMNHFVHAPRHTRARATLRTPPPSHQQRQGQGAELSMGAHNPHALCRMIWPT